MLETVYLCVCTVLFVANVQQICHQIKHISRAADHFVIFHGSQHGAGQGPTGIFNFIGLSDLCGTWKGWECFKYPVTSYCIAGQLF